MNIVCFPVTIGWGISLWGGNILGSTTTTLNGALLDDAFGTGGSGTSITLTSSHGFTAGDIILFGDATTFSPITGSNFVAADFADKKFMVTSVPSSTTITITMPSNETGAGATTSGGITYYRYYSVGPAEQLGAFGWGISLWGGNILGSTTTTLNGALLDDAFGTGGSGTSITLTSSHGFTAGDIILFGDATTFSPITGSNFVAADFADKKFMVTSVPSSTTITITMPSNETGS